MNHLHLDILDNNNTSNAISEPPIKVMRNPMQCCTPLGVAEDQACLQPHNTTSETVPKPMDETQPVIY